MQTESSVAGPSRRVVSHPGAASEWGNSGAQCQGKSDHGGARRRWSSGRYGPAWDGRSLARGSVEISAARRLPMVPPCGRVTGRAALPRGRICSRARRSSTSWPIAMSEHRSSPELARCRAPGSFADRIVARTLLQRLPSSRRSLGTPDQPSHIEATVAAATASETRGRWVDPSQKRRSIGSPHSPRPHHPHFNVAAMSPPAADDLRRDNPEDGTD